MSKLLNACIWFSYWGLVGVATPAPSQVIIGNGGDLIHCRGGAENAFAGPYALDYVATYHERVVYVVPPSEDPLAAVLEALTSTPLEEEFRAYATDFTEQLQAGLPNYLRKNVWSPRELGPIAVDDSYLLDPPPENCRNNLGKADLTQAVFHEPRNGTRWFTYDQAAFRSIAHDPLQTSMLATHEYLWRYAPNARILRDANRFLHEQQAADLEPMAVLAALRNIGLEINDQTVPRPKFEFTIDSFDVTTMSFGTQTIFSEFGYDLKFTNDIDGFFDLALYLPDAQNPGSFYMHRTFHTAPQGSIFGPNYAVLWGISYGYVTIQRYEMGQDANGQPHLYKVGPEHRVLDLVDPSVESVN